MYRLVLLFLGQLSALCAISMILPLIYSIVWENGGTAPTFISSILIIALAGITMLRLGRRHASTMDIASGAAFLLLSWVLLPLWGMLPYIFSGTLSPVNAILESVSGFTTTGETLLPDWTPRALIFWRSITQWLGGLNILLMLTTIMPTVTKGFGIAFAMPTILRTSIINVTRLDKTCQKAIMGYITVSLLAIAMFCYTGMGPFDAINFTMAIISSGGCYKLDSNFELNLSMIFTTMFGVLVASVNVLMVIQSRNPHHLKTTLIKAFSSTEIKAFLAIIFICSFMMSVHLERKGFYDVDDALLTGLFHAASFASTTGVMHHDLLEWPDFEKFVLIMLALIGGCLGSMGGGFKMFRVIILIKTAIAELGRTTHPHQVIAISGDHGPISPKTIGYILSFFFLYCLTLIISTMVISLSGYDMHQSLDAAIAYLTSTGQILYFHLDKNDLYYMPDIIKLYCSALMIIGRIEIVSLLLIIEGGIKRLQQED